MKAKYRAKKEAKRKAEEIDGSDADMEDDDDAARAPPAKKRRGTDATVDAEEGEKVKKQKSPKPSKLSKGTAPPPTEKPSKHKTASKEKPIAKDKPVTKNDPIAQEKPPRERKPVPKEKLTPKDKSVSKDKPTKTKTLGMPLAHVKSDTTSKKTRPRVSAS